MPSEESMSSLSPPVSSNEVFPTFSDLEYCYSRDDVFDNFTSDFDMLLPDKEETLDQKMDLDPLFFDSLIQEDYQWPEVFPQLSDLNISADHLSTSNSDSPLSPRSTSSSESSSSSELKFTLDTPPVSPPREPSPPVPKSLPTPVKKTSVLKINPKNVKIITCAQNVKGFKGIGKQTQIVLPRNVLQKVINIKNEIKSSSNTVNKFVPIPQAQPPIGNIVQIKREKETSPTPESIVQLPPVSSPIVLTSPVVLTNSDLNSVTPSYTVTQRDVSNYILERQSTPLNVIHSQPNIVPCIKQDVCDKPKGKEINMAALKRQQRMIKNRESASISRKKKKEYITNLENKVTDLEKENSRLKQENEALKGRVKDLEQSHQNFIKSRPFLNTNLRKTTALLAVVLMVSVNIGSMGLLSRDGIPGEFKRFDDSSLGAPVLKRHGRSLLWSMEDKKTSNISSPSKTSMCPLYVNQTESLRLEKELRRWIAVDKGRTRNTDRNTTKKANFKKPSLRELILHTPHHFKGWKSQRAQKKLVNALDLYRPPFPDSIPRRDDTFYVFSFSSDHLLLPAISHNKTLRPKMSFVIPSVPFNGTMTVDGKIPMMQIDCEVLATRSIQLTEEDFKMVRQETQPQTPEKGNGTDPVDANPYKPYFIRRETDNPYDENFNTYLNKEYRVKGDLS